MKKSKLIEKLQQINGNPDILIWNGFIGDWQDIGDFVEQRLVKQTKASYFEQVRIEECIDTKNWEHKLSEKCIQDLNALYPKVCKWDINAYVTQKDIEEKRYTKKNVILIDTKERGVKTFDRLGSIEY